MHKKLVFSARFACPECGYSISELEPRMFSFNNPAGACEACDGLGVTQYFDPDLVVADAELSLAEGAIRGWDRRNVYYFHMLSSIAEHYDFDVENPLQEAEKEASGRHSERQRQHPHRFQLRQRSRRCHPPPPPLRGCAAQHGAPLPRNRQLHGARKTCRNTCALPPARTVPAHG